MLQIYLTGGICVLHPYLQTNVKHYNNSNLHFLTTSPLNQNYIEWKYPCVDMLEDYKVKNNNSYVSFLKEGMSSEFEVV